MDQKTKQKTLLINVLEIVNISKTKSKNITQSEFLKTIFRKSILEKYYEKKLSSEDIEKMFSDQQASRIFCAERKDKPRHDLKRICIDMRQRVEGYIYKAFYEKWRIDIKTLEEKLDDYYGESIWLTNKERNELRRENDCISAIIRLLIIGLDKRQLCFEVDRNEEDKFVGRVEDISFIEKILGEKRICFLYGPDGYGKTTLARYIGRNCKYEDYVEIKYDSNLDVALTLCKSFPEDNQGKSIDNIKKQLAGINRKILLIIDDVDEKYRSEDDEFSKYIEKLSCDKIIIANHDITENQEISYKIPPLSESELISVFSQNIGKYTDVSYLKKREIISEVANNTYFVILCAKLLVYGKISVEELIRELKEGIFNVSDQTKYQIKTFSENETYNMLARKLYDMFGLSKEEKSYLFAIWIFREHGIDKRVFLELINAADANILNKLIGKGWIERQYNDQISIHKIIADCIKNERNKEKDAADDVSFNVLKRAEENICNPSFVSQNMSLKWLLSYYEIAVSIETSELKHKLILLDVFDLLLGEYPLITYLEKLNSKIEEVFDDTFSFYAHHNRNIIQGLRGDIKGAIEAEAELLSACLLRDKQVDMGEKIRNYTCILECFRILRKLVYKYMADEEVDENYRKEVKILEEAENDWISKVMTLYDYYPEIRKYLYRAESYFVDFGLHSLTHRDLTEHEKKCIITYLEHRKKNPEVEIELHKVKAILAYNKKNFAEANKEIEKAIDISETIDSPLLYIECYVIKLILELEEGGNRKEILYKVKELEEEYYIRENVMTEFFSVQSGIKYIKEKCSNVPGEN